MEHLWFYYVYFIAQYLIHASWLGINELELKPTSIWLYLVDISINFHDVIFVIAKLLLPTHYQNTILIVFQQNEEKYIVMLTLSPIIFAKSISASYFRLLDKYPIFGFKYRLCYTFCKFYTSASANLQVYFRVYGNY